ncbi:hypothetical protein PLUTO_00390 [Luteibacter phage vB_LflM-Pluto]|uniref:Uncharacterized protein n=1 Tax=Luteibacter phage vB_LflM-Pluto TaxID=2948611 RepID=A0A9E7MUM1_9CAUD|nr:hypothetical protein PLUTO_00390 [Luteibacter phage vB_LflM-Pluto]
MDKTASFSTIGKQITIRADLSDFSGRDKANLLNTLMEEAGARGLVKGLSPEDQEKVSALLTTLVSNLWNS